MWYNNFVYEFLFGGDKMLDFLFDIFRKASGFWFILICIVSLVVGLVLLIKGADFFVGSASKLAKKLGVSSLVIGLTVGVLIH